MVIIIGRVNGLILPLKLYGKVTKAILFLYQVIECTKFWTKFGKWQWNMAELPGLTQTSLTWMRPKWGLSENRRRIYY